jgi:hypothetical protein
VTNSFEAPETGYQELIQEDHPASQSAENGIASNRAGIP